MIDLLAIFAGQHQQAAAAESFANGFGNAFADPIEVRRFAFVKVEEGENRDGIGGLAKRRHQGQE